ncbi:uncharacterized protein VTP21DRAFT_8571 [Calcarisporiella thermophila]|uniref:uncharacterized protein n=1 Tax=Calcarisporiella thermophila TaxID=911321 RepID=UPI003743FD75
MERDIQMDEFYDANESEFECDSWIEWFCVRTGGYFVEVPEEFIEDEFNLTGLANLVPYYRDALEMILDIESDEDNYGAPDETLVTQSAELLYGLIHQRYIITRAGLEDMLNKLEQGHFGTCPRVFCRRCIVVPCGRYDYPGLDTLKLYCPNCQDLYNPTNSRYSTIDGAYFGTTFPHLFFHTYPELLPKTNTNKCYVPRIFGFRVSEKSRSGPRMEWLRKKPLEKGELDKVESDYESSDREMPDGTLEDDEERDNLDDIEEDTKNTSENTQLGTQHRVNR